MFVYDGGVIIGREISGEGGEGERRKQRILDGTPIRIGRLSEGGEDELDVERARARRRKRMRSLRDHRATPAAAAAGSGTPPKRRSRWQNSSTAASRSASLKSGHIRSVNRSSA